MRDDRLFYDLERLAMCTDSPGRGVTRFSWSGADRCARAYLERELLSIGLAPFTDGMGNIHAIMRGRDSGKRIIAGSHFDSVRNGGSYDGIYGVAAALEMLRSFAEEGFIPAYDVEFIAFVEEEGSNFGCTCLGSKAISGQTSLEDLKALRNADGKSAYAVLRAFGLNPDALPKEQIDPSSVAAYLEVHIEQNSILEQSGNSLGIVTAISGMRLFRISLEGCSDHAASPMRGRKDPMAGFAEAAHRMERLCLAGKLGEDFSCTIGSFFCEPGVGIIIPRRVWWTIDIRHVDVAVLERGWARIDSLLREVADARGLELLVEQLSASGGALMAPEMCDILRNAAQQHGVTPLSMVSGPAHDAAAMGMIVPAGMLFVPSVGGLSHCPEEMTAPEDLALGARVLETAVKSL